MYKGSSKCQGCGRSGTEAPRVSRLKLCPDCQQMLLIGACIVSKNHIHAFISTEGDVWCGGQKCEAYKLEATRCENCMVAELGRE